MTCRIDNLFEHPQHINCIAQWIHAEFWADKNVHTPQSLAGLLRQAVNTSSIPLSLLALVDEEPVGTVNLIENDDDKRAHLRPWLAALLVVPSHRGQGIGSALVRELSERSAGLGIACLYLGTDNPGFYERLGATVHEQVTDSFAIMEIRTGSRSYSG